MKIITVYNENSYTKKGKLKKNAKADYIAIDKENETIARELKEKYHAFTKPYFFTSIHALNENNEKVYIIEEVQVNNFQKLITSPIKLAELLV